MKVFYCGWRLVSVLLLTMSLLRGGVAQAQAPVAVTWTGAVSTDWYTAGNWNPAQVPGSATDVTVSVVPNQPVVSADGATCAALRTDSGASLRLTGSGHLIVNGYVTLFGTLSMTGGLLELKSLFNSFYGPLALTGGTVALSGAGLQLISGNNLNFWNLTIAPGTSYVRQDGTCTVKHVLRLGRNFDISNTTFFLDSDAAGSAMVVHAGGNFQSGSVLIKRYIGGANAGLGYRHLSVPARYLSISWLYSGSSTSYTPVVNAAYNTTGGTARPFPNFFGFEENRLGAAGVPGPVGFDQGWVSPASGSDVFVPGRGYTLNMEGTALPTVVSGFINNGDVAVGPLSHDGSGAFAGYHLLGNPYPAPIDWDSVARPTGLDNAIYVFRSTSQYGGFYDYYANGMGTLPNGQLAVMQGFFVHVSQAVPSFTFTNAARKTVYANPSFQRGLADQRPVLSLALRPATGGDADQAFIYFQQGATTAADAGFDAGKLPNSSGLNLASQSGGGSFAVNGLPLLGTQSLVLPLSVDVPAPGRYELAVGQLANFASGTTLYLRDAQLNTLTLLSTTTHYVFDLAGTTAPGRFTVEFRPAGALATATQLLDAQVQVYPNPATPATGATVIAPARASVTLLNALGQQVLPTQTVGAAATLPLPTAGLATGIYVLRVRTDAGEVSRRLVVD